MPGFAIPRESPVTLRGMTVSLIVTAAQVNVPQEGSALLTDDESVYRTELFTFTVVMSAVPGRVMSVGNVFHRNYLVWPWASLVETMMSVAREVVTFEVSAFLTETYFTPILIAN